MFRKIIKRDGQVVQFNPLKITNAILKAGRATDEFGLNVAKELTDHVLNDAPRFIKGGIPHVEEIQDTVEDVLMSSPYRRTAKAYIIYRDQRAKIRDVKKAIGLDLVDGYLEVRDWRVNENSNMGYSLQGLNNYLSSSITASYWISKIYTPEIREAQTSGDFHIHDLGILAVYCVGWDLRDLLIKGFGGVEGKVESKPARHLRSALGQIINFFYTLQGEAAGAQAFSNFDTFLSPFIRYDGLSYKELKQALQEFVFNVNIPTRVGFQTPFTNITLDITPPADIAEENVIVRGEIQTEKYKDFQKEMILFNKALAEVMMEGDAKGRVFTFPIPTYNLTCHFDWENTELDPIWEMTARYGIPYFANFINSDMRPEDIRSMCCRLRLDLVELKSRGGGLFGANPLTGSIGVVTINLPRIGHVSRDENEFLARLGRLMDIAKDSLEIKRKSLEHFTEGGLYPYARVYLQGIKERFGGYWKIHFSTIGIVGMNEALINFMGLSVGSKEGRDFTLKVLDFMRERLLCYQRETDNLYNLEATPAEGASYRLAKMDKKEYPDMLVWQMQKIDSNPCYTNSTNLPVNFTDDLFYALEHQDALQSKYTGGTVFHIYLGERMPDKYAVRSLIRKVMQNHKLPYVTITPTFSICPMHGYVNGEHETCPSCHETCEVYSRIVGYFRPVQQWNDGKREEFKNRVYYRL